MGRAGRARHDHDALGAAVVRGPYDALLLALGGRRAGLDHLSGDGLRVLAPRVATSL